MRVVAVTRSTLACPSPAAALRAGGHVRSVELERPDAPLRDHVLMAR